MKSKLTTKTIIIATSMVVAILVTGIAYAVISITTPTTIAYSAQPGTTMQAFTPTMCSTMDTYTTGVLTDTRNSQNYRVRKMPDGKCWMIDDLKLGSATLTPSNSNVSTNFTIGAENTATGYYNPSSTANSFRDNCIYRIGISPNSLTGCGYLYTFDVATATTGTAMSTDNTNAPSSICPAGWHLPTGGSSGEFAVLNGAMSTGTSTASTANSITTRSNWRYNGPFEGSLSGYYNTSFNDTGNYGIYQSSSVSSATDVYYVYFSYGTGSPGTYTATNSKSFGMAIRCVL